jgi:hypothetical protein
VADPVVRSIRHCFKYGVKHHFWVDTENVFNPQRVTVTDSDAIWVVDDRSILIGPGNIEFDATPSEPTGVGGTGSLTITVTNPPSDGGGAGSATAADESYYTGP